MILITAFTVLCGMNHHNRSIAVGWCNYYFGFFCFLGLAVSAAAAAVISVSPSAAGLGSAFTDFFVFLGAAATAADAAGSAFTAGTSGSALAASATDSAHTKREKQHNIKTRCMCVARVLHGCDVNELTRIEVLTYVERA